MRCVGWPGVHPGGRSTEAATRLVSIWVLPLGGLARPHWRGAALRTAAFGSPRRRGRHDTLLLHRVTPWKFTIPWQTDLKRSTPPCSAQGDCIQDLHPIFDLTSTCCFFFPDAQRREGRKMTVQESSLGFSCSWYLFSLKLIAKMQSVARFLAAKDHGEVPDQLREDTVGREAHGYFSTSNPIIYLKIANPTNVHRDRKGNDILPATLPCSYDPIFVDDDSMQPNELIAIEEVLQNSETTREIRCF